ncbi:LysR family transcriptional regulator [Exilibacterium tricleocarpae]|uniref:LysR family transcriptional regulator n=1 Tax=Exilibacterium tricleocarpae TaxID=2591008 RepID=A0A545T1Q6_9GAMM|nr:LysR family transcriptional regulator [Exilibacterium tricleocarpae]TQV71143.1 LysR family transcriptional regulator [Exilibacterium tricleocarpae]
MDWNLLPDFLAIVRAGTLAGAADSLRVNHSTVYRRLNQLETQLQTRLFERLPDGYQLTASGESLLPFAQQMEAQADALERQLTGTDKTLRGEVRLTAPENLAYAYLPQLLARFHHRYPDIQVTILVSNADLDLNRREADIALRATAKPPEYLVGRKVVDMGWSVFTAAGSYTGTTPPQCIQDTGGLGWVAPDASLYHLSAYAWLRQQLKPQQITARGSTLNTLSSLAEAGLGLALLPNDQQKPSLQKLFPVREIRGSALWLLTHPDLRQTGRLKVLMDFLVDALRQDSRL